MEIYQSCRSVNTIVWLHCLNLNKIFGEKARYPAETFTDSDYADNLVLYSHMPYHNDTIIKMQEDFFNKYVPLTLLQVFEKGYSRFACERKLETEQKL